ncbi:MAG: hypothetical protein R3F43_20460 [bacterium]
MTDSTDKNWVPEYKVKVDGQEIQLSDDLFLQSILVDLRRQAPASVEIQFNNKSGTYDNEDQFAPGNEVEVASATPSRRRRSSSPARSSGRRCACRASRPGSSWCGRSTSCTG